MVFLMVLLCKEAELAPRFRTGFTWGESWPRSGQLLTRTDSDRSVLDNHVIVEVKLVFVFLRSAFEGRPDHWEDWRKV